MRFILGLIGVMFALDALWWVASVRLAKPAATRLTLALFSMAQMAGLAWLVTRRFSPASAALFPKFALAAVFIWHMIIFPLLLLLAVVLLPILAVAAIIRVARNRRPATPKPSASRLAAATSASAGEPVSRRHFLGFALAVAPQLFNLSLAAIAVRQLDHFRVRRFILPIAGLPGDLDGLTIAQVSDMHVGRFTSGHILREMVRVVNDLRADLVLLTGDLINDFRALTRAETADVSDYPPRICRNHHCVRCCHDRDRGGNDRD